MVGCDMTYDWTKEKIKGAIGRALAQGRTSVILDVRRSSETGINRAMYWIREMGYEPFNDRTRKHIHIDLEMKKGDVK